MEFTTFMAATGAEAAREVIHARAPCAGAEAALRMSIFRPGAAERPAPLLFWLQAEGFGKATVGQGPPLRLARQMTHKGIALAVPELRLQAEGRDLSPALRAEMAALPEPLPGIPSGAAALAAMADAARGLAWLDAAREAIGLTGRPVLGGSLAGAVTALNLAYLAPRVGLDRPEPGGLISYSGGFAWPSLFAPGRYPVFALHNPFDSRMPIASARRMAEADPRFELLEAFEHRPGTLRVWPQEPRAEVFGRIRTLVRAWGEACAPVE